MVADRKREGGCKMVQTAVFAGCFGVMTIIACYAIRLKKRNTEQQTQIDGLKRELEEVTQKLEK